MTRHPWAKQRILTHVLYYVQKIAQNQSQSWTVINQGIKLLEGNVGENLWDLELQRLTIQKATTTNT